MWVHPYYLGTFERDCFPSDDTTPNATIVIYNDFGIVRYTFVYYDKVGGSAITRTGTVNVYGNTMTFTYETASGGTAKYFNDITVADINQPIESLRLEKPGLNFNGDFARVD